jgi:DNA-directed RNA polymerase subunit beta
MARTYTERKRIRKSFARIPEIAPLPNLIELQTTSYNNFLQMDIPAEDRTSTGLQEVFRSIFPISDFSGKSQLEFYRYDFDAPKYDVDECKQRGVTYSAPLRVSFRLIVWDIDEETGAKSVRDIKEQEVYMGDIPLMTENGTFIINGIERVVVSQMHRSPGVFFDHDSGKSHSSGKYLFSARVIPYRGSWLDFEFDAKDIVFARIDRKRKLLATTFLMALDSVETEEKRKIATEKGEKLDPLEAQGMSREEILNAFYGVVDYKKSGDHWKTAFRPELVKPGKLSHDLIDANTGKVVAAEGAKINLRFARKLQTEGLEEVLVYEADVVGRYVATDLINEETGEVYAEAGDEITSGFLETIAKVDIKIVPTLDIDHVNVGAYLRNTLVADKNLTREDALVDIYRILRPGEPPTIEGAENLFQGLFFDSERYDLSSVGRVKMNSRLELKAPDTVRVLGKEDIIAIIKVLLDLKDGRGVVDDIDNLGNRRVRSVGELLENQYRVGLSRMERAIRERMSSVEIDTVMPHDLINAKPAAAVVREFFGTSQLSQFMDQTNPLSEINHKRRLSALGPGGLTRDRATFEVRDVHPTHYGRICPIETPEGPNIGLINSLATYARVNKYGFIETPYRKVIDGKVTKDITYLTAMDESKHTIAQANAELGKNEEFTADFINCRQNGEVVVAPVAEIDLMDVSPKQIVSVAASLIPFVEHDDANRALMGSNMQRQAVPLLRSEAPFVGTGMEGPVARDSGVAVIAKRTGVVDQVDASRIVIRVTDVSAMTTSNVDIYNLLKFQRSNDKTCINQKPLVKVGDKVEKGDIIADGPCMNMGELALGSNALVAFVSWNGYNFEDSIIISERIVKNDIFTSIHIEEFEIAARDTKLGNEEITRDIPNVGDEALRHLDEAGIVYIGADVKSGDILVGKVTPKGEAPSTPEEKLLRAIFGEKASDVRDTSLRLPPGVQGTVVEVRVFSRRGVEKDERSLAIERAEIERLAKDRDAERSILDRNFYAALEDLLLTQKIMSAPGGVKKGTSITKAVLDSLSKGQWRQITVEDDAVMSALESTKQNHDKRITTLQERFEDKVDKLRRGDELPTGVLKLVKVFVAVKRKLQPGDKMAGRHGNKGVVSRIVPIEDMPHLEDGTPVDIVLNPLGLPSRMNVGQILETHLGWAAAGLGRQVNDALSKMAIEEHQDINVLRTTLDQIYEDKQIVQDIKDLSDDEVVELATNLTAAIPMATSVFDGADEADINHQLKKANLDTSGQVVLIDGRTGEPFDRKVTVGYMYMLKLHHLVDDKIHARSVGPYSLVTQQPLGGKAQFGGQRFGEMEVWALEAYGASYTLQEMLTVKSDDVSGRTKVYESIVRGDDNFESGIPESFNVLMKELRSLGLNVELGTHE